MTGALDAPFAFADRPDMALPLRRKKAAVVEPPAGTAETFVYQITGAAGALAVSTSADRVHLYDPHSLRLGATLAHHSGRVTDMQGAGPSLLYTSSEDRTVMCWDLRAPVAPLLCLSLNSTGAVLAAGAEKNSRGEAPIYFWDVRGATAELACFLDTHYDDVYQVCFHQTAPSLLLTASEDGQMALLDVGTFDEEEAPVHCFNTEISIDKAGFFGSSGEHAYCVNTVPTFSLWSVEEVGTPLLPLASTPECRRYFSERRALKLYLKFRQGDLLCKFGDLRSVRDKNPTIPLDYVIDCKYDAASGRLYAITGSYR
ncbi:MAG: WD40-repeat-containing domain protein [Olpidium bornovanus]|uniref:WD40-repeat-containing domain protein n=1 Tax=Olpidium bornovanus TaxID=278681 RepID=A0A8H8DJ17_9FUNG|nr:MAG: WD40-repeat-containing domain protein [Olpidium bornovanus]